MAVKKGAGQKATAKKVVYDYGTGRRKSAVARVFLKKGTGKVRVNDRELTDYFPGHTDWAEQTLMPLKLLEVLDQFDVMATVKGGGMTGQAGALRLGVARALDAYELRLMGLTMADVRAQQDAAHNAAQDEAASEAGDSAGETGQTIAERPWHVALRAAGFLTRDARVVQRKLVGLVKARKAKQFSKR